MSALRTRFAATLSRFRDDREGSAAIMFALALVPTIIVVGAGIDYGRAVSERSMLQSGVDAGALAGIQQVRRGLALVDATTTVKQVVAVNDANPAAYVMQTTLSSDGTTLCVKAASAVPTTLMAISGYKSVAVGAYACSSMRLDTYEIAFAFDNSGSMANSAQSNGDTKLQAAVKAANGLVAALSPSTGSIGVPASYALVPFNSLVNVDPTPATPAAFMDLNGQSSIHWQNYLRPSGVKNLPASRFAMFSNMGVTWGGCVEERPSPYTTTDTQATSSDPDTLFVPFLWPDETDINRYGSRYNAYTMNDYLDDGGGSCVKGDASDAADQKSGTGDGQTKLCKYRAGPKGPNPGNYVVGGASGPNASCTTTPLQPLNATIATTTKAIAAMRAGGDTALVTGVMWAWRAISPKGPFDAAGNASTTSGQQKPKPYGYIDPATSAVNHKIIILMTDGMNHWYGQHGDPQDAGFYNSQGDANLSMYNAFGWFGNGRLGQTDANNARSLLDAATLSACTNAKAAKDPGGNPAPVEIYTVGFLATDGIDPQGQTLLQQCATQDGNHSFIATTGDALVSVFQQIAATITQPRIQK